MKIKKVDEKPIFRTHPTTFPKTLKELSLVILMGSYFEFREMRKSPSLSSFNFVSDKFCAYDKEGRISADDAERAEELLS